jgi:hypothetical protein
LVAAQVRADSSPYLARENPLAGLLPSAQALREREQRRLEAQIDRVLTSMRDVKRAELVLLLPAPDAPLDQAQPRAQANLRVELLGVGPSDAELVQVIRAALPDVASDQVRILRQRAITAAEPAANAPVTTRVGPFVVARESSALLRATLAACLGANVLLAALLLARRRGR